MAKKVPCLSKFFARYKDIFGQWFAVTPQLSITEPPGTLDLETIPKKIRFDTHSEIDLSRGGVDDPEASDPNDLISWLEGNRRQDVIMHQLADQVGNLNPGEYISPKLMFPSHTLPDGSWHSFILGRIWGFFRGLGEIFSTIFGLLIVGRLVWYLVKVLMNCSYIHSVHCCSAQLAWSFCTEVFFTRNYGHEQKQQAQTPDRTDNDPSHFLRLTGITRSIRYRIRNLTPFRKGPSGSQSDSEEGTRPSASTRNTRMELRDLLHPPSNTPRRQDSWTRRPIDEPESSHDYTQRLQSTLASVTATMAPFPSGVQRNTPPPSYRTPPPGGNSPSAPNTPDNDPANNVIRVYRPEGPLSLTGNRNRVRLAFTPEPETAQGPATPQRPTPQRPAPQRPTDPEDPQIPPPVWREMSE